MNEPLPDKPPRRPRYSGKNPRHFHEKYKEHHPERYASDVAKVIASGKTPAGTHRPIMVREILAILKPQPGEVALDCTLGYGGHAQELLSAVQPGGKLYGVDADPIEFPKTVARLMSLGYLADQVVTRRMNYAGVSRWLAEMGEPGVDVLIADLGLSSMQIDDPSRGFTFKGDGPLEMRMNPQKGFSAATWLSRISKEELASFLVEGSDEPHAELLAGEILKAHRQTPLSTTHALANVVRQTLSRANTSEIEVGVRRVFQAIRIAVNDEFGALDSFLRQLPNCLKPGGRAAILTFHSGEDRRVKHAFRAGMQAGDYAIVSERVVRATQQEQRDNPRSSSAKLRFAVRAGG